MLKKLAIVFGIVFVAVGILGFVPGVTTNGHLLGIFHVNAAHNLVHIVSGILALMVGFVSEHASRLYFRWFGLIYGLVALLGLIQGERPLLGVIANNYADVVLHFVIAAAALIIGFAVTEHRPVEQMNA
jgi:hypothetical protein